MQCCKNLIHNGYRQKGLIKKIGKKIKSVLKRIIVNTEKKVYTFFQGMYISTLKQSYTSKVFCIGYNKTGTTTLGKSLDMLGYKHSSFNRKVWFQYYANKQINKILKYTSKFDSFDDLPWLKEDIIPLLDKTFPNSKFVYLTRDEKSWKISYFNFQYKGFGEYPDVDKAWEDYKEHERFVLEYFKDRDPKKFIILDVRDEMGFKKLADFLGKKTDIEKFPHCNKTLNNKKIQYDWKFIQSVMGNS